MKMTVQGIYPAGSLPVRAGDRVAFESEGERFCLVNCTLDDKKIKFVQNPAIQFNIFDGDQTEIRMKGVYDTGRGLQIFDLILS